MATNKTADAPPPGNPAPASPANRDDGPVQPRRPLLKRPLVAGSLFLVILAGLVGGTLAWLHSRHYESTDDAFIDVQPEQVSAQIGGRVIRVLVTDNQPVAAGDLLLELDSAEARTAIQQADAAIAQADAQLAQAEAQRSTFTAQVEQARANLGVAQTNATNAAHDLRRFAGLRQDDAGAVSAEQWDRATAADKTAAAQVEAATKAVAAAEAQVHYADSLIAAARAAQSRAAAGREQSRLQLSYAAIHAHLAGRVAHVAVAPGDYVQPGTALLAVVPTAVHVTANFKETQLAHMRPGQPVALEVDAYPDLPLTGRVDSIQPGTGQAFSALPAENATGNWVKVVQRVPVKITLHRLPDRADLALGPGLSVTAKVTVR